MPTTPGSTRLRGDYLSNQSLVISPWSLGKSGLSGRLPRNQGRETPLPRGPRERTRATGGLLEHASEFAHRLHPNRSIEPQPVQQGSQMVFLAVYLPWVSAILCTASRGRAEISKFSLIRLGVFEVVRRAVPR